MAYDSGIYDLNWFATQGFQHPWIQKMMGWLIGEYGPFVDSLDVGAGDGYYSVVLNEMNIHVWAIELPAAMAIMPETVRAMPHDLRLPLDLGRTYDLMLCIEVAEHLPPEAAGVLCDTLARHCSGLLVFTAAQPGQAGHGHINCQPPEYWREKLEARGLVYLPNDTAHIRRAWQNIAGEAMGWLHRNVMLFRKEAGRE